MKKIKGGTKEERMERYRQKMAKRSKRVVKDETKPPKKRLPPRRMSYSELRELFCLQREEEKE